MQKFFHKSYRFCHLVVPCLLHLMKPGFIGIKSKRQTPVFLKGILISRKYSSQLFQLPHERRNFLRGGLHLLPVMGTHHGFVVVAQT